MNKKTVKIVIDVLMTAVLILLMLYSLIGEELHEWFGAAMFVLFITHHILNYKWSANFLKGKYNAVRAVQTCLVFIILVCMLGSFISGVILSRYLFGFLSINSSFAAARKIHMLSAYWGFVFMSVHLGFHWNIMIAMSNKLIRKRAAMLSWITRIAAILAAGYGIIAFIKRELAMYLFLKTEFFFYDFSEGIAAYLIDYIAILGLFVFIGHYGSKVLRVLLSKKKAIK